MVFVAPSVAWYNNSERMRTAGTNVRYGRISCLIASVGEGAASNLKYPLNKKSMKVCLGSLPDSRSIEPECLKWAVNNHLT